MKYIHKAKLNRGEVNEGILILLALCLVIFVFILPKKGTQINKDLRISKGNPGAAWGDPNNSTHSNSNSSGAAKDLRIGSGNASYEIQNYLEYITLDNRGGSPVNITGFILSNAKDKRSYAVSGNDVHYASDKVSIPEGALYISPTGNSILQNIVLKDGEDAVITSGNIGNASPYRIISFKENVCSGYLESSGDYNFTPSLKRSCPVPSKEPGFSNLDQGCQDFLGGFSSCHVPTFNGRSSNGEPCNGCVDGTAGLSNSCVAFIQSHSTYKGCIANHKNDADFNLSTWRIFLGAGGQLWADKNETISLYDRAGALINSLSY